VLVDIVATLIELKPGNAQTVDSWADFVESHRLAAEQTLLAEGVKIESWFAVTLGGKDYLLCYMRAESIDKAHRVAARSENPVDKYHHEFKQNAWVRGGHVTCRLLVDLQSGV
jgi:hypothetical protein